MMTVISIKVDDETLGQIENVARVQAMNRSEAVRFLLRVAIFAPDKVRDAALGYQYGKDIATHDMGRAFAAITVKMRELVATIDAMINASRTMRMVPIGTDYPDVNPATGLAAP